MTEELEQAVSSPMRKLKSIFPNSPLSKHTPLDIYLAAPVAGQPRALVFRYMGSIENDWVATEFVLHYFEGDGPSPPVRPSPHPSLLHSRACYSSRNRSLRTWRRSPISHQNGLCCVMNILLLGNLPRIFQPRRAMLAARSGNRSLYGLSGRLEAFRKSIGRSWKPWSDDALEAI